MAPAAAAIRDGAAADDAAVAVSPGPRLVLVVSPERVALPPRRVAHQSIVDARVVVEPLVLRVFLLLAVLAPAALFEDDDLEARRRELFGHDAAGGTRSDDDEVDLS